MRVKSRWFKEGKEHGPQELAGAVAFIAWRIAENMLKNLRRADFDIAVGPQYFAFLAESLVFVVQVADRFAWRCLNGEGRVQFTSALANRVAANLAENRQRLLGADLADSKAEFIDLLNLRASDYAEFELESQAGTFSFLCYFAHSLSMHLDEKDRHWVSDQIISLEGPEAIATVEKAMNGLLDKAHGTRRATSFQGGD